MLATIGVKSVLWAWCSRIPSSGVQALAQDAENDVWLNVVSLSFPVRLRKWLGADSFSGSVRRLEALTLTRSVVCCSRCILSLSGSRRCWRTSGIVSDPNVHLPDGSVSGRTASPDQYARILYLVTRFNPVLEISDVECYHIGDDLTIEVDVILPHNTSLHFAHDVGETIQCMLENLGGVLRAYVHCDYSSKNPAQHTARKKVAYPVPPRSPTGYESTLSGSATPKAPTPLSLSAEVRCSTVGWSSSTPPTKAASRDRVDTGRHGGDGRIGVAYTARVMFIEIEGTAHQPGSLFIIGLQPSTMQIASLPTIPKRRALTGNKGQSHMVGGERRHMEKRWHIKLILIGKYADLSILLPAISIRESDPMGDDWAALQGNGRDHAANYSTTVTDRRQP
ncbi:hypothetical protein A1Q1_00142 [Trichosporon asahii var. asahii CBS 2479]|uniref:Uncharacterized protein n=1 Tax=Trichosporon asahii var. asahii (strain ATCC 90039 / CBS 2479 / JCM 2466 / KCTC 7840 / NBRC 103889/ NCYC 2677 / UAMH 7654) TaxID=1186058 RepID=J5TEJ3_TRIAS|nr:hypothetical protein A1Q1_00142 [Trichosporon asahii var. asahii CBS 2479]EJT50521.1 hypothetical protein A1Q1_00142 [Trichosporon asahii var. asahii CBS 2479]